MAETLYKTIKAVTETEFIEKKSRFICVLHPVTAAGEAADALADIRRRYPGATHYCYAWRIREEAAITEKYSDDGEPGGTAGLPMLNVIKTQELENVLAVVVRYFGGTLLGAGGLVRAYSRAVVQALEQVHIIYPEWSQRLQVTLEYGYYNNFQNKCLEYLIKSEDTIFADKVIVDAWVSAPRLDDFITLLDQITERTAAVEYTEKAFVNRSAGHEK